MTPEAFIATLPKAFSSWAFQAEFAERDAYGGPELWPGPTADAFLKDLGLSPPEKHGVGNNGRLSGWYDLESPDAHRYGEDIAYRDPAGHLARFFHRSMAYDMKMMSAKDARRLAEDFYSVFDPSERRCLSNGLGNGWCPVTDYTFDRAFVAMDRDRIGLILFCDED